MTKLRWCRDNFSLKKKIQDKNRDWCENQTF